MQTPTYLSRSLMVLVPGMLCLVIMMSSCLNTRQFTYMQGKFDTARLSQIQIPEPTIQKGDLISVVVYSDNPTATAIYNQSLIITPSGGTDEKNGNGAAQGVQGLAGASPTTGGYLVDDLGNIEFQGLGLLHVEGLTRKDLKDTLDLRLKKFLLNPYYTIRFLNYKFTMLGEVARQGVFSIPGDHISLLEALGVAGDITFYGRRDNILVIRQNNGKREFARLDITKPEIMGSPYFYLQQNDVVYVEQTKKKLAADDQVTTRNITLALTIISTAVVIYSLLRR
jgi:polysaccharide export outer membrane protein